MEGGSYVISKALSALAGFFGGLSVSFFYQPKKLHQHGKLVAGAIIGGISVAAAFALGGMIAKMAGMDFAEADVALSLGYLVGAVSVGFIAWIANFLEKREGHDIVDVVKEVRGITASEQSKPRSKPKTKGTGNGKRKLK